MNLPEEFENSMQITDKIFNEVMKEVNKEEIQNPEIQEEIKNSNIQVNPKQPSGSSKKNEELDDKLLATNIPRKIKSQKSWV